MYDVIKIRRDTEINWKEVNPLIADGEIIHIKGSIIYLGKDLNYNDGVIDIIHNNEAPIILKNVSEYEIQEINKRYVIIPDTSIDYVTIILPTNIEDGSYINISNVNITIPILIVGNVEGVTDFSTTSKIFEFIWQEDMGYWNYFEEV